MSESAGHAERAESTESAVGIERAVDCESTAAEERAGIPEGAEKRERARPAESAESSERATIAESAVEPERAEANESAVPSERAVTAESADVAERATPNESAVKSERAASSESAAIQERPRYGLGYPHIETSTHKLWDAQQAGWPDHLPHQAWRAMVHEQNREKQPVASSADHPAFKPDYVPNYLASEEGPADQLAQHPGVASRQRR